MPGRIRIRPIYFAHTLVAALGDGAKSNRKMAVLSRYRDGSYLSILGGLPVRVAEAEITVA